MTKTIYGDLQQVAAGSGPATHALLNNQVLSLGSPAWGWTADSLPDLPMGEMQALQGPADAMEEDAIVYAGGSPDLRVGPMPPGKALTIWVFCTDNGSDVAAARKLVHSQTMDAPTCWALA